MKSEKLKGSHPALEGCRADCGRSRGWRLPARLAQRWARIALRPPFQRGGIGGSGLRPAGSASAKRSVRMGQTGSWACIKSGRPYENQERNRPGLAADGIPALRWRISVNTFCWSISAITSTCLPRCTTHASAVKTNPCRMPQQTGLPSSTSGWAAPMLPPSWTCFQPSSQRPACSWVNVEG